MQICGMIFLSVVNVRDFMLRDNIWSPNGRETMNNLVKNMNQNFFLNGCNILYMHWNFTDEHRHGRDHNYLLISFLFRINLELEGISFLSFCLLLFICFSTKLEAYNKSLHIFKDSKKEVRTTNLISWPQIALKKK